MSRILSVLFSALIVFAAPLVARTGQQPVFRTGVPTVSIYATVVDSSGRLVPNLTQDDFEVYDNGKRQDLMLFTNDIQPITLVMMLDRSQSMEQHFGLVRDAAEHFVANLLPEDRVRLGSFSDRIRIDPETFTSDKQQLTHILRNNLVDAGSTPLWNATGLAITALAHEEGRRVVLLFTDGYDGPDFATRDTNLSLAQVRQRANAEDVMVYAIGLATACDPSPAKTASEPLFQRRPGGRGGVILPPGSRGVPRLPMPGRGGQIPRGPGTIGLPRLPPRGEEPERPSERAGLCVQSKPDPDLKTLTYDGGGGYFELKGPANLAATFARIADELHHQYMLAYRVPAFDGQTHQIDVRPKQRSLSVRARKTYVASPLK